MEGSLSSMKQLMIGNAHLDPVWFWRWQEGYQEVKATFRSALDRMNEFPGFIFTCACADYYRWVEENAPDMFEEIRSRVSEGRWVIVGGMWIQPDLNISSGESLARQLLLSQRYFKERFGLTASVGYNVDGFGHSAMLPQLYRKAGVSAYVWMRPGMHENSAIPEGPMIWESADGSRIRAFRIENEYTCARNVEEKIERLFAFSERIGQPVMCFYGVGNHGGGPTIANLEAIERVQAAHPHGSDVLYASPNDYFALLDETTLPVWKTELQHHASGCYSTHSRSKQRHREAENALVRMEKLGVLAACLTGHEGKAEFIRQAWHNLLFSEFHAALGGCAAEEVLEAVVRLLDESISIAQREENAALQRLSWQVDTSRGLPPVRSKDEDWRLWGRKGQGTPVVVFNPHAFEAEETVLMHMPVRSVRDDKGRPVPCQTVRANRTNKGDIRDAIFRAKVPAFGWRLYWAFLEEEEIALPSALSISHNHMENALLRADFDPESGSLIRLINRRTGLNVLAGPSSVQLMDISHCDTWAHNIFTFDKPAGVFGEAAVSVWETGPVRVRLCVTQRHGESILRQLYTLYEGADQLETEVFLDLREHHRMVKFCYPTLFADGVDTAEIPGGVITRNASGEEEPCQRWCAMQGAEGGLAVLNNGRYSYSAKGGELRLTVANTSIYADHYGQTLRDDACRYMDQGELHFACALVPYSGSWREARLHQRSDVFNQPLPHVVETYHTGPLGAAYSGFALDNPAIAVWAFKRAEDGCGHILRLAEATGAPQRANAELPLLGRTIALSFGAYEVKTLYLPKDGAVREVLLTEAEEE